jgi:hypothetical protein
VEVHVQLKSADGSVAASLGYESAVSRALEEAGAQAVPALSGHAGLASVTPTLPPSSARRSAAAFPAARVARRLTSFVATSMRNTMTAAYVTDGHFHPPRGTQGGGDAASSEPYKLLADDTEEPLRPISQEDIQPGWTREPPRPDAQRSEARRPRLACRRRGI